MPRTAAITISLAGLAALAVVAWAVAWPLDVEPLGPGAEPAKKQGSDAVVVTLPPPDSFAPLWERPWQDWVDQPVAVTAPTPATSPDLAALPEAPPGFRYVGAILEAGHSYGFFATPGGARYAGVGQRLGREAEAPTIVSIEPDRAVLKIGDKQYALPLERTTTTNAAPGRSPVGPRPGPVPYAPPPGDGPRLSPSAPSAAAPGTTSTPALVTDGTIPLGRREVSR